MCAVGPLQALVTVIAAAAVTGRAAGAPEKPGPYALPLAEVTDWTVIVFSARSPLAGSDQPVPFTVHVRWEVSSEKADTRLAGAVATLRTVELPLQLPAGCTSLTVALDWAAPGVDLDLGLFCPSRKLHLAPILTVLKPEQVRWDEQTAPLYEWLQKEHPDWWKGYPFWPEVDPAPIPARGKPE